MFILYASKTQLMVRRREPVTSGSVNVYQALFEFSEEWDGLDRVAVFRAGPKGKPFAAPWTGDSLCQIPWEVLTTPGLHVQAGVYGTRGDEIVLPTRWADLGVIQEGASPGETARPPTPELWRQELERKGDKLGYTESGDLGLYSGDKLLSAVPVVGGGGSGGPIWGVGHGLKVVAGDLTVDAVDDFTGDNTLPMTAAGVLTTVGNIEALLGTI